MPLENPIEQVTESEATEIICNILQSRANDIASVSGMRDAINNHQGTEKSLLQKIVQQLSPRERREWELKVEQQRKNPLFSKN